MPPITLTAADFRSLVEPVMPLAGKAPMLPALTGVLIESHGGWLTATATDRFRVGMKRIPAEVEPGQVTALVPVTHLKRILTIFKPSRGSRPSLALTVEDDVLYVEAGDTLGFGLSTARIGFPLLDAEFPKVATIFAEGLAQRSIPADPTGVAPAFLADLVKAAGGPAAIIRTSEPGKPLVVVSEDYSFVGLLMPRRLDGGRLFALPDWGTWLAPRKRDADAEAVAS